MKGHDPGPGLAVVMVATVLGIGGSVLLVGIVLRALSAVLP